MEIDFDIDCPECGAKVKVALQDVAKERTLRCRHGHSIAIKDEGHKGRQAQKAMDDLDQALKSFGR